MISITKIELNNFRFFIDEDKHNTFEPNEKGMLIYGENGSGKSSLYKAFEFLSQTDITENDFKKNRNIFNLDEDTYLEFNFTNNEILRIDIDHLSLDNSYPFIEKLSISKPLLDYKSLLKVHYRTNQNNNEINIYKLFEKLLEDYPITEDGKKLKELRGQEYFNKLEDIVKNQLFYNINMFLEKFEQSFKIESISFDAFEREVILNIEYFNEKIEKYHIFLNEARLSALAISIYFAIIKKQFDNFGNESSKILVLDDLLISLDMSNRLNLLEILKTEFSDFQIFFFTHDKALFEVFKGKMPWKSYEIYVDNNGDFEKPYIKESLNYFQSAKKHFEEFDYPACANYLRKEVERIKKIVIEDEINGIPIDKGMHILNKLLNSENFNDFISSDNSQAIGRIRGKLIGIKDNLANAREPSVEVNLKEMHRILHPQSHDDTSRPLYKKELEEAIEVIKKLREDI